VTTSHAAHGHQGAQTIQLQARDLGQARETIQHLQYAPIAQNTKPIYWVPCHKVEEQNKIDYIQISDMPVHVSMGNKIVPEKVAQEAANNANHAGPSSPRFFQVNGSPISDQVIYFGKKYDGDKI
jgi:hypothetical protein